MLAAKWAMRKSFRQPGRASQAIHGLTLSEMNYRKRLKGEKKWMIGSGRRRKRMAPSRHGGALPHNPRSISP